MKTRAAAKTRITLALAKTSLAAALLGTVAYCQITQDPPRSPEPASADVVSSSTRRTDAETPSASESIKPLPPAPETSESEIVADPASLLPDLPPVPRKNATLVGGTLQRLDRVRDQVTVRVFGGGEVRALFDPRTHVYRGGKEVSIADLHQGDRVYLDTILDGSTIFAKNIRLFARAATGESRGVVLRYRPGRDLTLRDGIAPTTIHVTMNSGTRILQAGRPVASSTLVAGSLISVSFSSENGGHDVAREVSILASPGTPYTFAGQVVHIDLRSGLLVISSSTDHRNYEIYLDPSLSPDENLQNGASVTVIANFENSRYVARQVNVSSQSK